MLTYKNLIAALPVAPIVREELQTRCEELTTGDHAADNPNLTAREIVAYALIDIEAMGEDCGDFYRCPSFALPDDMRAARKEWRAIWRAARLLLAGNFYPEFCDYNAKMREIDAQNLASGLPLA